jgi:hypothetical protein
MSMGWLLRFAFFTWLPNLPEKDFGKIISGYATSFDNATGFAKIMKSVFGSDKTFHFKAASNKTKLWPHPSELLQFLIPRGQFGISGPDSRDFDMTREMIYPTRTSEAQNICKNKIEHRPPTYRSKHGGRGVKRVTTSDKELGRGTDDFWLFDFSENVFVFLQFQVIFYVRLG